jgi:hypothetical protein
MSCPPPFLFSSLALCFAYSFSSSSSSLLHFLSLILFISYSRPLFPIPRFPRAPSTTHLPRQKHTIQWCSQPLAVMKLHAVDS